MGLFSLISRAVDISQKQNTRPKWDWDEGAMYFRCCGCNIWALFQRQLKYHMQKNATPMWSYDRGAKYFKCWCWNHSDISGRQSRLKKNISWGGIISDQQKLLQIFVFSTIYFGPILGKMSGGGRGRGNLKYKKCHCKFM